MAPGFHTKNKRLNGCRSKSTQLEKFTRHDFETKPMRKLSAPKRIFLRKNRRQLNFFRVIFLTIFYRYIMLDNSNLTTFFRKKN